MQTLCANELKTAGIGAIARALDHEPEVGLSVRGQLRYVVMPADAYQRLRDCELEIALQETRAASGSAPELPHDLAAAGG